MKKLRVTLLKSLAGIKRTHVATVRGLGLRKINQSVELNDTASVRGMVNKVAYLVRIDAA